MLAWLARLPLLVSLIGLGGLAMYIPAIHAVATGEAEVAEVFFWIGTLTLVGATLFGIALAGRPRGDHPRRHLAGFLLLFVAMPFLFASLRISSATAVIGAVVGEWIGSDKGLGAMIIQATFNYQSGRLYAAITLCSCLAIALFVIVVAIEKVVLRYEHR